MRSSHPFLGAGIVLAVGFATLMAQTPAKPAVKPAPKPAATASTSTDPVVISVGTETIHASQFDALVKAAPPQNQAEMNANKRAVADELGKMLALVQEAHRRHLDEDPSFKAQMMLARDNALAKSVVDKLQAETTPTDAAIKAYYDAHTAEFSQAKVRHILIGDSETPGGPNPRTQAEALTKVNQIETQLKSGGDFATLAKANSDDPGSKDKGGDLGDISPGETVPEFETAVNTLPIGKVSDPVHTRFGYHIIEVESRTTMPFEQAKPQIAQQLAGDAVNKQIDQLASAAHVVISDSFFGPAKPTPPPTTPHQ